MPRNPHACRAAYLLLLTNIFEWISKWIMSTNGKQLSRSDGWNIFPRTGARHMVLRRTRKLSWLRRATRIAMYMLMGLTTQRKKKGKYYFATKKSRTLLHWKSSFRIFVTYAGMLTAGLLKLLSLLTQLVPFIPQLYLKGMG